MGIKASDVTKEKKQPVNGKIAGNYIMAVQFPKLHPSLLMDVSREEWEVKTLLDEYIGAKIG